MSNEVELVVDFIRSGIHPLRFLLSEIRGTVGVDGEEGEEEEDDLKRVREERDRDEWE